MQHENFQGKFQRCKARIDSDGNFENVESSELRKSRFIGDSSTGATNICMIYNYMIKIIMIMYVFLIAMHAVKTIDVYTLVEENLKKIPVDKRPPQAKLKIKRGITMDSGAGNNVLPRRMVIQKSEIRDSEGSKNGVHYVAANNGRILNQGEYDFNFSTVEGNEQCLTFQIAEVNKALCAISNLVDHGFKVVFDKNVKTDQDTSHMLHNETGVTTRFRRTRNVWVLDAFVDNKSCNNC